MRLPRGPSLVAGAMLAVLVLSVVVTPRGPAGGGVLPPDAPSSLVPDGSPAGVRHAAAGISVSSGWRPEVVFGGADPWAVVDPHEGVRAWVEALPRLRLAYDDAGRLLVEDAVVLRDPAPCYHVARVVRRVGVGLPPPAGPAIAQQIEGWLAPPYFSPARLPDGSGPCEGPSRSRFGFAIEQAEPLTCEIPGRDVLCVTVAKWRFDFAERDEWTAAHLVFDATDGATLTEDAMHPGLDVAAFDALVDEVVCAAGGRCDGLPPREGRVRPTRDALIVELSPGEGALPEHGSVRVSVPRDALPLATAR